MAYQRTLQKVHSQPTAPNALSRKGQQRKPWEKVERTKNDRRNLIWSQLHQDLPIRVVKLLGLRGQIDNEYRYMRPQVLLRWRISIFD